MKKLRNIFVLLMAVIMMVSTVPASKVEAATVKGGNSIRNATYVAKYNKTYVTRFTADNQTKWFKFKTKNFDGFYTLYGKNVSMTGVRICLCDVDEEELFGSDCIDLNHEYSNNIKLKKNTMYYIKIVGYTGKGNCKFKISARKDLIKDTKNKAKQVKLNKKVVSSCDGKSDKDWFKFKPTKSGDYTFSCKNLNTQEGLRAFFTDRYDEEFGASDCIYKNGTYSISVHLKKGKWYYIRIEAYDGVGNYRFKISKN